MWDTVILFRHWQFCFGGPKHSTMGNEKISWNCFEESEILLIIMPLFVKSCPREWPTLFVISSSLSYSHLPFVPVSSFICLRFWLCYCIYLYILISLLCSKVGYNLTTKPLWVECATLKAACEETPSFSWAPPCGQGWRGLCHHVRKRSCREAQPLSTWRGTVAGDAHPVTAVTCCSCPRGAFFQLLIPSGSHRFCA